MNKRIPTKIKSSVSNTLLSLKKYPTNPPWKATTPIATINSLNKILIGFPLRSKSGSYINSQGKIKLIDAFLTASIPVGHSEDLASAQATKTARHTGGVIAETFDHQRTKRWAPISGAPRFISAGAARVANIK